MKKLLLTAILIASCSFLFTSNTFASCSVLTFSCPEGPGSVKYCVNAGGSGSCTCGTVYEPDCLNMGADE